MQNINYKKYFFILINETINVFFLIVAANQLNINITLLFY